MLSGEVITMKDWPYKSRDLAIADLVIAQMARLNEGILRFIEDYQENEKTHTCTFKLPPWIGALANALGTFYRPEELIDVVGNVLEEVVPRFRSLSPEDAALFCKLVQFALSQNLPAETLH